MSLDQNAIRQTVKENLSDACEFLCKSISFPSTSGNEHELMCWMEEAFGLLDIEVEQVPLAQSITFDAEYSNPISDINYDGRFNLRMRLPGSGVGSEKTLLLNTHVDVVPASEGQISPFEAIERDGMIYGRGACDAKGQIAAIYLTLAAIKQLAPSYSNNILVHLVNEEENGGNGTLAMMLTDERADACIVMEPTDCRPVTCARGALWFRVTCKGRSAHSGQPGRGINALNLARRAMDAMEKYHADLLDRSRSSESLGVALFEEFENPMPLTFGCCRAGNWPATSPALAVFEGVLGFLPNRTREEVMHELRQALADSIGSALSDYVDIDFTFKHEPHVIDPQHPLVTQFQECCRRNGQSLRVAAMNASCDAWLYSNKMKIPTLIYGPGRIEHAHGNEEQIAIADIASGACTLVDFASG